MLPVSLLAPSLMNISDGLRLMPREAKSCLIIASIRKSYPCSGPYPRKVLLNYIPLKRFTLCLPDANALLSPSEADEEKQWETVRLGMEMAARIFS